MMLRRSLARVGHRLLSTAPAAHIGDLAEMGALHRLKLADEGSPFLLPEKTSTAAAAQHLLSHRLTFALIEDEAERTVVGMVTERDLLRYAMHAGDLAFFSMQGGEQRLVRRWMTPKEKMLSVRLDDRIDAAAQLVGSKIWRHLPVLDYWGRLHSILDLRDVVAQVVGEEEGKRYWKGKIAADVLGAKRRRNLEAASAWESGDDAEVWQEQLSAYLLAHAKVHTVPAHQSVEHAARLMLERKLTFLVIVDGHPGQEGRAVGLVHERSFLTFLAQGAPWAAQLGETRGLLPISDLMTPLDELLKCSVTDPADAVIDIFFANNVRHLPVIDHGRLLGIISARDLLRPLM